MKIRGIVAWPRNQHINMDTDGEILPIAAAEVWAVLYSAVEIVQAVKPKSRNC